MSNDATQQQQQPSLTRTRSFMDAVADRYGAEDDSNAYSQDAFDVGNVNAKGRRVNNKKWEMVGMDAARQKQSNHGRIAVLGLQNCNISLAEQSAGQLAKAGLTRVRELNLSDNKALQAADIDTIVSALPSLVELQLSGTDVGNVTGWTPLQESLNVTAINPNHNNSNRNQSVPAAAARTAADGGGGGANNDDSDAASLNLDDGAQTQTQQQQQQAAAAPGKQAPQQLQLGASYGSLAASCSEMSSTSPPSSPFRSTSWKRLTTLALNRCNMSWAALLEAFPPATLVSLVSLHLESNNIDRIFCSPSNGSSSAASSPLSSPSDNVAAAIFPALKELNLSFNLLTSVFDDDGTAAESGDGGGGGAVAFLTHHTPKLTSLNLTGNRLSLPATSTTATATAAAPFLARLEVVSLGGNKPLVSKYKTGREQENVREEPLEALHWLRTACPALRALRVGYDDVFGLSMSQQQQQQQQVNNARPLCRLSEVQQRLLVIASIGQLELLNSGPVRQKERMDAEMLYLQVAKARTKQIEAASLSDGTATTTTTTTNTSALVRFFPWTRFPLLSFLEDKHKDVVLSNLGAVPAAGQQQGGALNYTLTLTFRVMAKDEEVSKQELEQQEQQQDEQEIEGTTRSQRRERVKKRNATALTEDVTRTVPGNMTVGRLRSFVASIFPQIAPIARQRKLQAYSSESTVEPPTVLQAVDDEQPLILCGVPSSAVVEVFV